MNWEEKQVQCMVCQAEVESYPPRILILPGGTPYHDPVFKVVIPMFCHKCERHYAWTATVTERVSMPAGVIVDKLVGEEINKE